MDVKNINVSIQPTWKSRQQLHILQKQSHAVSTAAGSIYGYDDDITNHASSHAAETDTEDEEAEFARCHNRSAAHIQSCMYCLHESQSVSTNPAQVTSDEVPMFSESLYDSDSNSSNSEQQGYERILTVSDIHSWQTCDSGEEMIAYAQPQYVTLQEITD